MNGIFQLDEKMLKTLRTVTIFFIVGIIITLTLINYGVLTSDSYQPWAYQVAVGALIFIGLLHYFWTPPSTKKHRFFLLSYHLIAILICTWITGYTSTLIVGWLLLIIGTALSLSWLGAALSSVTLIASMTFWWLTNPKITSDTFIFALIESLFVISIAFLVTQIVIMAQSRGFQLNKSKKNEQFQREQLLALVNSMGDAVIATNEEGIVRIYNAAASNLLDTNTDLIDKPIDTILKLQNSKHNGLNLSKLLAGLEGNIVRTDILHEFDDHETIHLYLNIAPINFNYQQEGERGYIFILRDITHEKSLEQEKDEFISVVSHELRTPIAIAEGSLSNALFLQNREVKKEVITNAIKDAYSQINFLSRMANDLSTLSRAERGKETLEVEELDIPALLDEIQANYITDVEKKGLKLSTKIKGSVKPFPTSKLYVQEIMQNFVTNALKYTREGSILISADMEGKNLVLSVKDTGIGISKSDQKHLFEKFFRSEDYRTRESSGTGLGLYLVKKLLEQLNASVDIKSRLNHGSTFSISIPPLENTLHK